MTPKYSADYKPGPHADGERPLIRNQWDLADFSKWHTILTPADGRDDCEICYLIQSLAVALPPVSGPANTEDTQLSKPD